MEIDWIIYKREQEKARVLVGQGFKEQLEWKRYPALLTLTLNIYRVAETAEQAKQVQAQLQTLHDAVEARFADGELGVWIGRVQSNSRLELFYYVTEAEAALAAVQPLVKRHSGLRTTLAAREDAEWDLYDYLQPSELEVRLAYNASGLIALSREGFRIGQQDRIHYYLRFPTNAALQTVSQVIGKRGFRIENIDVDPDGAAYPHRLELSIVCPLEEETLDRNTAFLVEEAALAGGKYDWWSVSPKATAKRTYKLWIRKLRPAAALLALLLLVGSIGAYVMDSASKPAATTVEKPLATQKTAPVIKLKSDQGAAIAFGRTGHPTVLNFCDAIFQPCEQDYLQMQKVANAYKDRLDFYTIRMVKGDAALYKEHPSQYPIVIDEKGDVYRDYHARTFPITYVVDSRGVVIRVIGPGESLTEQEAQRILDSEGQGSK